MIPLLLHALAVGALACAAAHGVARVQALRGRPQRWAWAGAIVGILAVPALARLAPTRAAGPIRLPAVSVTAGAPATRPDAIESPALASRLDRPALDRPLTLAWLAGSLATGAWLLGGARRLARLRRRWRPATLDGVPVRVAPDVGPAVLGWRRPVIVVPAWALALDADARALLLAHEREHLRARDPLLVTLALVACVLVPWHPALWWALARLRDAVELDCDARVLAGAAAPRARRHTYAALLLDAGERALAAPRLPLGTIALGRPSTLLARRVAAMTDQPLRRRPLRVALATVASLSCAGLALALPRPASRAPQPLPAPDVQPTPSSARPSMPAAAPTPAAEQRGATVRVALLDGRRLTVRTPLPPSTSVQVHDDHGRILRVAGDTITVSDTTRPKTKRPDPTSGVPFFEFQIDEPSRVVRIAPPAYPDSLRASARRGEVIVQFVVDTTGRVDRSTLKIVRADHPAFDAAAIAALADSATRFSPARVGGRAVKQLVQLPFQFAPPATPLADSTRQRGRPSDGR